MRSRRLPKSWGPTPHSHTQGVTMPLTMPTRFTRISALCLMKPGWVVQSFDESVELGKLFLARFRSCSPATSSPTKVAAMRQQVMNQSTNPATTAAQQPERETPPSVGVDPGFLEPPADPSGYSIEYRDEQGNPLEL